MRGTIELAPTTDGLALLAEGQTICTLHEPTGPDADTWPVTTPAGAHHEVRFTVPATIEDLVESGAWEPVGVPEISAWATDVVEAGRVLNHADITVSTKSLAPVVVAVQTASGLVRCTAEQEWSGWVITLGDRLVGRVSDGKEISFVVDEDLPLPVLVLITLNVLGVTGYRSRPWILTARRMERKTRESLERKHGDTIGAATKAGHDVRYLSTWSSGRVYGWFECVGCGRAASTFETAGGEMLSAIGLGTTKGKLRGRLLDGPCPGKEH